jgi:hypothetical protein
MGEVVLEDLATAIQKELGVPAVCIEWLSLNFDFHLNWVFDCDYGWLEFCWLPTDSYAGDLPWGY